MKPGPSPHTEALRVLEQDGVPPPYLCPRSTVGSGAACDLVCRYRLDPQHTGERCALDVADRGEHTLEECGAILGVTRERVRQLEQVAISKLRRSATTMHALGNDDQAEALRLMVLRLERVRKLKEAAIDREYHRRKKQRAQGA